MIRETNPLAYETLFALPDSHSLSLSSRRCTTRNSTIYETRWLNEHDQSQKLIARFRTWKNQSLKPPYRKQVGWERYSLAGKLLDREVRYSKRATNDYLH